MFVSATSNRIVPTTNTDAMRRVLLCTLLLLEIFPTIPAAPTAPTEQNPLLDQASSDNPTLSPAIGRLSSLVSTGQTVLLDDVPYYIPPDPVGSIPRGLLIETTTATSATAGGLLPLTVFNCTTSGGPFGAADLQDAVDAYSRLDDVFSSGFLQGELNLPDSE